MSSKFNRRQARHGLKYSWTETRDRIRIRKAAAEKKHRRRTIRETMRGLAGLND